MKNLIRKTIIPAFASALGLAGCKADTLHAEAYCENISGGFGAAITFPLEAPLPKNPKPVHADMAYGLGSCAFNRTAQESVEISCTGLRGYWMIPDTKVSAGEIKKFTLEPGVNFATPHRCALAVHKK